MACPCGKNNGGFASQEQIAEAEKLRLQIQTLRIRQAEEMARQNEEILRKRNNPNGSNNPNSR